VNILACTVFDCDGRTDRQKDRQTDRIAMAKMLYVKTQSFWSHKGHMLCCQTPDHGQGASASCCYVPVLIPPTQRGMAKLSWPGWLVTYQDGLPACWQSPKYQPTRPNID